MKALIFITLLLSLHSHSYAYSLSTYEEAQDDIDNLFLFDSVPKQEINDPLEKINRIIFDFNVKIDNNILHPTAHLYKNKLPNFIGHRIDNFYSNAFEVENFIAFLIKGELHYCLQSMFRFLINSTIGMFGLFDVASKIGLRVNNLTIEQAFAARNFKPGPYLVIPFLGASSIRGLTAALLGTIFTPLNFIVHSCTGFAILHSIHAISNRSKNLDINLRHDTSLDVYAKWRNIYSQNISSFLK